MSEYTSVTKQKVRVIFLDRKNFTVKYDILCKSIKDAYRVVEDLYPIMYVQKGKNFVKAHVTYNSLQKHLKRDILRMTWFNVLMGGEHLIAHVKVE